ncbi:MAG TPA: family 65 glycosyl hydrolase, partial [Baekduia sp.]|nr:family 65 glycosyl hydrolase [Baekduia sp.]
MLKRPLEQLPEHIFPPDPWRLVEQRFTERFVDRGETIFALSNGYLGVRGTPEEGRPVRAPATYINGFHETWPIIHPEEAFGIARHGQTMVKVPEATTLQLFVDDEPLHLPTARLRRYSRVLDFRAGMLERELTWSTPGGRHVRVRSCRLVSLEHRHVVAVAYEVVLDDCSAPLVIRSEVRNLEDVAPADGAGRRTDPRVGSELPGRVLHCEAAERDGERLLLGYRTSNSGMTLGVGVDHVIETDAPHRTEVSLDGDRSEVIVTADGQPGVPVRITKFAAYQSSRSAEPAELAERCRWTLDRVVRGGFGDLRKAQRAELDLFWDRADVRVEAGERTDAVQQAVRWNLFQVAQATWRAEGTGVPAKGLTGRGYEGHYFWDTEVYLLPVLSYTQPRIARNLLRFRHSMLPKARERARELNQRGAMFPWRTINGDEASPYFQAGTAQYHLNADIAYAIRRYVRARGDLGFLVEVGAELLVETARMWEDLGFYAADGAFHIHGVTGPD